MIFQESVRKNLKSLKNLTKIINGKINLKQGQFTKEELDAVLKKIKNRKAASLNGIRLEV